ncbi:MAG: hypothetical protein WBD40_23430 [Tepidisphaeraceae bacterium]
MGNIDPAFLAKARELRDRWMERVNDGGLALDVLAKHDVSRALTGVGGGGSEVGDGSGGGGGSIQPPTTDDQRPTQLLLAG